MAAFLVSDRFHSHPRVLMASPAAIGVWARAGCRLAGGGSAEPFLPRYAVELLGSDEHFADLVRCWLWERARRGYRMPHAVPSIAGGFPVALWKTERSDYRRKIPSHIRDLIFDRDGSRCTECGATADLTLDHIHPWSLGGKDTSGNLRVLCRPCNSSKGARV